MHQARCGFKRQPGKTYHLYRQQDGTRYLSMLSPAEWGGTPPHVHLGAYRLENDMSWTPAGHADHGDDTREVIARLLDEELT
jgi:hypothetical protein